MFRYISAILLAEFQPERKQPEIKIAIRANKDKPEELTANAFRPFEMIINSTMTVFVAALIAYTIGIPVLVLFLA